MSLGKSDFRAAFKTLPPSESQQWLCWTLIFNPVEGKLQVAPLYSQVFGSVGAVVAWYRTATALQAIMDRLFHLNVFIYVDDCFWTCPDFEAQGSMPTTRWQQEVFHEVASGLLGWELDPAKSETGTTVTLLGLSISMEATRSEWRLDTRKAEEWSKDIARILRDTALFPSEAAKLAGRLAFLNSQIFNKLGRSLLRPIIWRQLQECGTISLTARLRWSLRWFERVLQERLCRTIRFNRPISEKRAIIYSDAEGDGNIAGVLILGSSMFFYMTRIPSAVRKRLRHRRTNIIAFELIAAILSILVFVSKVDSEVNVHHYIDSTPALSCIVRGFSKQNDLLAYTGMLWFEAASTLSSYYACYVRSKSNLADAPSRGCTALMKQLGAKELSVDFPSCFHAADHWLTHPSEGRRLLMHD